MTPTGSKILATTTSTTATAAAVMTANSTAPAFVSSALGGTAVLVAHSGDGPAGTPPPPTVSARAAREPATSVTSTTGVTNVVRSVSASATLGARGAHGRAAVAAGGLAHRHRNAAAAAGVSTATPTTSLPGRLRAAASDSPPSATSVGSESGVTTSPFAPGETVAPADTRRPADDDDDDDDDDDTLALTTENVDMVLEDLRPYLLADGGNVSVLDIDGATVRLVLEGACGSCPASAMTMKMGIEKRLVQRIPEIESVVAVEGQEGGDGKGATAPTALTESGVEEVLDQVRPFLKVAGGSIELVSLSDVEGAAPTAKLQLSGTGAAIQSVKVEISSRLRRNFASLSQVEFV